MLSIHLSEHALSYSVIIINQSIHINLSAGAQNITGTNVLIMLVCRRLLTACLPGKAACDIVTFEGEIHTLLKE